MRVDSACLPRKMLNNLHIMSHAIPLRRFTRTNPCPICGGHDGLGHGRGIRCFGYYDSTGAYARCTREEYAGRLPQNRDGTYSHRLSGDCRCGQVHGDAPATGEARSAGPPGALRRRSEQRFRSFFTLEAFLRRRYGEGTAVRHWIYRDCDGHEVFRVLRVNYRAPDGSSAKSYRPCHKGADGKWLLSRPEGKLPLYNLPAILAAPPEVTIAVLEGEKCADLAAAIGLPHVTTSPHGRKRPGSPTGRRWPAGPLPSCATKASAEPSTPPGCPPSWLISIPRPRRVWSACPACPTARTSSNGSRAAATTA